MQMKFDVKIHKASTECMQMQISCADDSSSTKNLHQSPQRLCVIRGIYPGYD